MSGLNSVSGALAGFRVRMSGMAAVTAGFGASIVGLGTTAVNAAADFETLTGAFVGLAGGAAEAKSLLADMEAFASRTPFQFEQLAKSVQRLAAYGFDARDAFSIMARMGDLAASAPGGLGEGMDRIALALGQIRAKGKTSAEELNQLAEAGINAREAIAKRLGVDVPQAMQKLEAGAVDARTGIMAILDMAADPKFAGRMERASQELNGLFSTLKDSASIALRGFGEIIIEGLDLKNVTRDITAFVDYVRDNMAGLRPVLMYVGQLFGAMKDMALTALKDVINMLNQWGLSIDASAPRLADLRQAALGFFQDLVVWGNKGLNVLIRFGGYVLEYVIQPMFTAAEAVVKAAAAISNSFGNFAEARALWEVASSLRMTNVGLGLKAEGLQARPLDAGQAGIISFFLRSALGFQAGGGAGGALAMPGLGELKNLPAGLGGGLELKAPGAAELGSREAGEAIARHATRMAGTGGDGAEKIRKAIVEQKAQIEQVAKAAQGIWDVVQQVGKKLGVAKG